MERLYLIRFQECRMFYKNDQLVDDDDFKSIEGLKKNFHLVQIKI